MHTYNSFSKGPILFSFSDFSLSDDQLLLVLCFIKDPIHDGLRKMHFTVYVLFYLESKFELSLCPNTKLSFLKYQCDGISLLSFV